jgi:hypothetical protein
MNTKLRIVAIVVGTLIALCSAGSAPQRLLL